MRTVFVGLVTVLFLAACSSSGNDAIETGQEPAVTTVAQQVAPTEQAVEAVGGAESNDGLWPTVVEANASTTNGTTFRFDVTLLSEYDSPERYADAWRVLDADDLQLGIRVLGHDHAGEQPFTRSHSIDVPADVTTVFIEGRDQVNGWSGERFELIIDR